ncbi:hypothetical protein [Fischerella sp. JS2]|uniref:hypothetical protein n=1 Tax=Fischerella sp. JS2 TaxID=2597771 RepID=UPI0028E79A14|nr:hypothetical protein [Fischerella sp. JS2]
MIYYALSMGVLGSHNCHLVRIFWQIGRINLVGRFAQQKERERGIGNRQQATLNRKEGGKSPYFIAWLDNGQWQSLNGGSPASTIYSPCSFLLITPVCGVYPCQEGRN